MPLQFEGIHIFKEYPQNKPETIARLKQAKEAHVLTDMFADKPNGTLYFLTGEDFAEFSKDLGVNPTDPKLFQQTEEEVLKNPALKAFRKAYGAKLKKAGDSIIDKVKAYIEQKRVQNNGLAVDGTPIREETIPPAPPAPPVPPAPPSKIPHVSEADFQTEVLDESSRKLVLVDFYWDQCPPCKALEPKLEEMSEQAEFQNVKFFKINADETPNLAKKYRIRSVPSLKLFKNGQIIASVVGNKPKEISTMLKKALLSRQDDK